MKVNIFERGTPSLARLGHRMRRMLLVRGRGRSRGHDTDLHDRIAAVPMWWHSIELGGQVTPGVKPTDDAAQLEALRLPDLAGKTVLDVGAWDGFYSFAAERLGAAKVVALDHRVWSIDRHALERYRRQQGRVGLPIEALESQRDVWRPDTLPGKQGFDLAHEILDSRVEPWAVDFMEVDLTEVGTFDVVLFLGVLYHLRHPLLALERLATVTRELAVIETEAATFPTSGDRSLCEFFEGEYKHDPSNWWLPNERALVALCRAAGFTEVHVLTPAPRAGSYRLIAHALR